MVFHAAMKCKEIFVQAEKNMQRQKLWSDTPTAAHLTKLGEAIVASSWTRASQYKGTRVSEHQWEVQHNSNHDGTGKDQPGKEWQPIPRFRRVRVVDLLFDAKNNVWYLTCTCCNFQRCGYGCEHIAWVLQHQLGDSYQGFSHRDVSVHWLSSHFCYGHLPRAAQSDDPRVRSLTTAMRYLQLNEVPGPLFPVERLTPYMESLGGQELTEVQAMAAVRAAPAKARLENYSQEKVEQAVARFAHKVVDNASGVMTLTGQGIGAFTQESYLATETEDDDFSMLCVNDNDDIDDAGQDTMEGESCDEGSAGSVVVENDEDDLPGESTAHSQQLQVFLQGPAVVVEQRLQPRAALKASIDEMLSVIEGSARQHDFVVKAQEMIRDVVASVRASCLEDNALGTKRSAIVSFNQERETKKCRQFVANHGIR
jgi:hypothetical protein